MRCTSKLEFDLEETTNWTSFRLMIAFESNNYRGIRFNGQNIKFYTEILRKNRLLAPPKRYFTYIGFDGCVAINISQIRISIWNGYLFVTELLRRKINIPTPRLQKVVCYQHCTM